LLTHLGTSGGGARSFILRASETRSGLLFRRRKIINMRRPLVAAGRFSAAISQMASPLRPGADIGSHYANYVALMGDFDLLLCGRIYRLSYKKLAADLETGLRRFFSTSGFLRRTVSALSRESARRWQISTAQVQAPLYASSVVQWVPSEPWLGALKSALGAALDRYRRRQIRYSGGGT
jgi:hypothetical protein